MTEYFAEDGKMHAATIVAIEPVVVTQIKNMEKDGYTAVQVGYGVRKEKNVTKALKGHFGDNGLFMSTREFRVSLDEAGKMNSGDKLTSEVFAAGDVVTVSQKRKVSRVSSSVITSKEDLVHTVRNTLSVHQDPSVEVSAIAFQKECAWEDAWVESASPFPI